MREMATVTEQTIDIEKILKGKLFTDSLVRLFAKLFFDDNSSNG